MSLKLRGRLHSIHCLKSFQARLTISFSLLCSWNLMRSRSRDKETKTEGTRLVLGPVQWLLQFQIVEVLENLEGECGK
jgi:hypothetical protein